MRGAKSLVYAALLQRGMVALAATGAVAGVLLSESVAAADTVTDHVRDVKVQTSEGGGVEIEIVGTGAPTYNVRVADGGRRLLIDLSDSDVAGAPAAITTPVGDGRRRPHAGLRDERRAHDAPHGQPGAGASYRVVPQGTTSGAPRGRAGPPSRARPRRRTAAAAAGRRRALRPRCATSASSARRPRRPAARPTACDRVVVDLGSIPAYSLSMSTPGRPRLELRATALPETLARTLDVSAYGGALKTVTASHDATTGAHGHRARRAPPKRPGTVSVEGGTLVWSFPVAKPTPQPSPIAQRPHRRARRRQGRRRRAAASSRWRASRRSKDLPRIETSIHDEDPVGRDLGRRRGGLRVRRRRQRRSRSSATTAAASTSTSRTPTSTTSCASSPTSAT